MITKPQASDHGIHRTRIPRLCNIFLLTVITFCPSGDEQSPWSSSACLPGATCEAFRTTPVCDPTTALATSPSQPLCPCLTEKMCTTSSTRVQVDNREVPMPILPPLVHRQESQVSCLPQEKLVYEQPASNPQKYQQPILAAIQRASPTRERARMTGAVLEKRVTNVLEPQLVAPGLHDNG